jgi:hypothetical protein
MNHTASGAILKISVGNRKAMNFGGIRHTAHFEMSAFVRMFPCTDCYGRTKSDTVISAEICQAVSFSQQVHLYNCTDML